MYHYRIKPEIWRGFITGTNYKTYRIQRWAWFWPFWEENFGWPIYESLKEAKAAIKHLQQEPVELQKGE